MVDEGNPIGKVRATLVRRVVPITAFTSSLPRMRLVILRAVLILRQMLSPGIPSDPLLKPVRGVKLCAALLQC